MAFEFSPKDRKITGAVRRITREQCDDALALLGSPQRAEPATIHAARKAAKKIRGLLRLVRPRFDGFAEANTALRDAARHVAALRDAEVALATLDTLSGDLGEPLATELHAALDGRRQAIAAETGIAAAESMAAAIRKLGRTTRDWRIEGEGFAALEPGLTATWKRARKGLKAAALAQAERGFPAAPFHEWRKTVKHHWYQARLLRPIWPQMMEPHIVQAEILGDLLGDHNDLDMLDAALAPELVAKGKAATRTAGKAIMARRRVLAAQAVALGTRLLAEPADSLAGRWHRWWEAWRG